MLVLERGRTVTNGQGAVNPDAALNPTEGHVIVIRRVGGDQMIA